MKRVISVGVVLLLFSASVLAGQYLMNDSNQTARGLRVVFSEPVTITSYGDVLSPRVEPGNASTAFTFSGGPGEPWRHGEGNGSTGSQPQPAS